MISQDNSESLSASSQEPSSERIRSLEDRFAELEKGLEEQKERFAEKNIRIREEHMFSRKVMEEHILLFGGKELPDLRKKRLRKVFLAGAGMFFVCLCVVVWGCFWRRNAQISSQQVSPAAPSSEVPSPLVSREPSFPTVPALPSPVPDQPEKTVPFSPSPTLMPTPTPLPPRFSLEIVEGAQPFFEYGSWGERVGLRMLKCSHEVLCGRLRDVMVVQLDVSLTWTEERGQKIIRELAAMNQESTVLMVYALPWPREKGMPVWIARYAPYEESCCGEPLPLWSFCEECYYLQ